MANYATLKAAIQQVVKTNGNNEITGALLQQSLLAMINSLGANYQFAGIATPSTNPGTPDQNVFYIAATAGTYTNFDALVVATNQVAIFTWNGAWVKIVSGLATSERVTQLDESFSGKINRSESETDFGIVISMPETTPVPFISKAGEKYLVYNNGSGEKTISTLETIGGTQYNSTTIPAYFGKLIQISGGPYNYLRSGLEMSLFVKKMGGNINRSISVPNNDRVVNTPAVGQVLDPAGRTNSSYKSLVIPVYQGQIYYIKGTGGSDARLFAITDSNYIVLARPVSSVHDGYVYIFQDGYLVVNFLRTAENDLSICLSPEDAELENSISESNEFAKNGIILNLKAFGYGFISDINVGDIGYNTSMGKLIRKTTTAGAYEEYPFSYDTLYYYDGKYYRYDGTGLAVNIAPKNYAQGFDLIALERGAINNSTGLNQDLATTLRTVGFVPGGKIYSVPDGLSFRSVIWYDKTTHKCINNAMPFTNQYSTNANYDYRFVIQKGTSNTITETCYISDVTQFVDVADQFGLIYNKNYKPIGFDYLKELRDVSELISEINPKGPKETIIERVYAGFDGLVTSFPDIVTKSDAAEIVSLSYPEYANLGGVASGDYLATPTYRTYLYKFSFGGSGKKQPMLIIGGLHGLEYTASMNLFLFAKTLCNLSQDNAYRLLNYFDIYVVPCLNGYGMYHEIRYNANGVDLNRNFPTNFWSRNDANHTGETGGSEFETQLVMALYNLYLPTVVIDHHAYDITDTRQLYAGCNERKKTIIKEAFVDCAFAFAHSLPQYFDNANHNYLRLASRRSVSDLDAGYLATWADEKDCLFAAYVEVGSTILYRNGQYNPSSSTTFGDNVFSIADCTLWNQIMRFAEFAYYNEYVK